METNNIQGKDVPTFKSLVSLFHKNGGKKIITERLEPDKFGEKLQFNYRATAIGENGEFTGHGDASSFNTTKMIAPHANRMAETRAIARALRLYNNIGEAIDVEFTDSNIY